MIKQRQLFTGFSFLLTVLVVHISLACYSQDSINKEKYLVIESNKFTGWQRPPTRIIFKVGKNVTIKKYNDDKTIRGKIDSISDSSITVKGNQIKLNDIKRISSNKGTRDIIIGSSSLAFFTGLMIYREKTYVPEYNDVNEDVNAGSFTFSQLLFGLCAVYSGAYTIFGIVEKVTIKYYRMDKDCKLFVNTKNKK